MTKAEFRAILQDWCLEDADGTNGIEELKRDLEFLERELFHEYTVTAQGNHAAFGYRLAQWIGNADSEADRQTLYGILKHLFFIGKSEQVSSYRTAFSKHVLQWLMDVSAIDSFDVDALQKIKAELIKTRFTEVTDSFGIRDFCLVNEIQGEALRYRWEGNIAGWDAATFRTNVLGEDQNGELRRTNLVLFEDFVGSGSQMLDAVNLAVSLGESVNVLLCPLFICPEGATAARNLVENSNNLTFSPVLAFEDRFFLTPTPVIGEPREFPTIRDLLVRVHPKIQGLQQEYGPFGYRQTGGFIVPSSNCPDNTIPALHRRSANSWEPLFLRTSRLPI